MLRGYCYSQRLSWDDESMSVSSGPVKPDGLIFASPMWTGGHFRNKQEKASSEKKNGRRICTVSLVTFSLRSDWLMFILMRFTSLGLRHPSAIPRQVICTFHPEIPYTRIFHSSQSYEEVHRNTCNNKTIPTSCTHAGRKTTRKSQSKWFNLGTFDASINNWKMRSCVGLKFILLYGVDCTLLSIQIVHSLLHDLLQFRDDFGEGFDTRVCQYTTSIQPTFFGFRILKNMSWTNWRSENVVEKVRLERSCVNLGKSRSWASEIRIGTNITADAHEDASLTPEKLERNCCLYAKVAWATFCTQYRIFMQITWFREGGIAKGLFRDWCQYFLFTLYCGFRSETFVCRENLRHGWNGRLQNF